VKQLVRLDSVPHLAVDKVESADLVVVLTGHSCVDYGLVVRAARAVLDTRNATSSVDASMGRAWAL